MLRSVAGAKPVQTGLKLESLRDGSAMNGGHPINSFFKQFLYLMMAVEGGTFDVQRGISYGFTYAANNSYESMRLSGRTLQFGNGIGSVYQDLTAGDDNVGFDYIYLSTD